MKNRCRKLFSSIFLFVFFSKMIIAAAPLIADHFDCTAVNAVIMQLEIEHSPVKGADTAKELSSKGDWISLIQHYNFVQPSVDLPGCVAAATELEHMQTFYPPVPTPPPSV